MIATRHLILHLSHQKGPGSLLHKINKMLNIATTGLKRHMTPCIAGLTIQLLPLSYVEW